MPYFSERSKSNLEQCHINLQCLFNQVIRFYDCTIIEGYRGKEEQNKAYSDGKSQLKFPESKHNELPSLAVDVVPYFEDSPHIRWDDKESFYYFAGYVKSVANSMGIKVRWGGDWDSDRDFHDSSFIDFPHWELTNY